MSSVPPRLFSFYSAVQSASSAPLSPLLPSSSSESVPWLCPESFRVLVSAGLGSDRTLPSLGLLPTMLAHWGPLSGKGGKACTVKADISRLWLAEYAKCVTCPLLVQYSGTIGSPAAAQSIPFYPSTASGFPFTFSVGYAFPCLLPRAAVFGLEQFLQNPFKLPLTQDEAVPPFSKGG